MTDTIEVEVLTDFYDAGAGTYRRAEETFEIESEFVENNPRLVEPVDDEADEGAAGGSDLPDGPSGTLPFNPEDHTNAEIEERAADIDDPEAVRALRNVEAEQKNRDGAADALGERLDELTAAED